MHNNYNNKVLLWRVVAKICHLIENPIMENPFPLNHCWPSVWYLSKCISKIFKFKARNGNDKTYLNKHIIVCLQQVNQNNFKEKCYKQQFGENIEDVDPHLEDCCCNGETLFI